MEANSGQYERVLLVGVRTDTDEQEFARSMQELKSLAKACNMEPAAVITQNLDHNNKALYVGTGKVQEIKETAILTGADVAVFDLSLIHI